MPPVPNADHAAPSQRATPYAIPAPALANSHPTTTSPFARIASDQDDPTPAPKAFHVVPFHCVRPNPPAATMSPFGRAARARTGKPKPEPSAVHDAPSQRLTHPEACAATSSPFGSAVTAFAATNAPGSGDHV